MLIIYALDLDLLALVLSLPDLLLGFVGLNGQRFDGISYLLFFFFGRYLVIRWAQSPFS